MLNNGILEVVTRKTGGVSNAWQSGQKGGLVTVGMPEQRNVTDY